MLTVDAAVQTAATVAAARQVALRGGGGTDLTPGLEAAVADRSPADVVVVLTDGFTPWPAVAPRRTTSWVVALLGPDAPADRVPDWATVVVVGGDR